MHERGQPREHVSTDDLREASPELRAKLLALAASAEVEELGSARVSLRLRESVFQTLPRERNSAAMSEPDFDFLVIGGGSAGYARRATAARLGLKTAVVEGGAEVGGLCILRGCMPSKTLLESAHRAEAIRHAGEFGLHAEFIAANGPAIRARKRRLIGEFADYRRGQLEDRRFDFIRGQRRVSSIRTPSRCGCATADCAGSRRATFLVATGSVVAMCPICPDCARRVSGPATTCSTRRRIPASVVILGGGAIALELASYYCGVGSKVTVIQRGAQVLTGSDADVADTLAESLERRGIVIHRGTTLVPRRAHRERQAHPLPQGDAESAEGEQIICALGRRPGARRPRAGKGRRRRRARSHPRDTRRSSAARRISSPPATCAARTRSSTSPSSRARSPRATPRACSANSTARSKRSTTALKLLAIFTHPQVATVGLSESECAAQGHRLRAAKYLFADHGKSLVRGETDGFVKLIVERDSRRILGAACVGPEASELIHEIVVAMHFRATAGDLARVPHYHPTLSEIWTYPAEELA